MRLILLTTLTMVAFAANSVLNRMGLAQAGMDPVAFGTIRLVSGAAMLGVLVLALRGGITLAGRGGDVWPVCRPWCCTYMGFPVPMLRWTRGWGR
ncbi:hypothetical protein SAMN06265173_10963 [Thalassovita litoralis]|uniref:EamA-like transporter family protein n=1 Tax=Thalassovita litoralis TaxID=1010611 RepID=A0A521D6Y5_9RHOB|nr:hypothetical protein SAMN06265173_10963 [Thalassovita litoralis]